MKSGNFQGRVHFGNLGVDGRMLLKYNFRHSGWETLFHKMLSGTIK